jgi:non-specific serine/threonine protein kinase/serine/threonine-protein kinase
MADHEQLIDALFAEVIELSPAERESFFAARLAENLDDAPLVDEVKALLTNYRHAEAKEFLDQPFAVSQTLKPGEQFAGYKINKLIAEGGMGEVYLAEDAELKRNVALKLIKGHATPDILRRFHSERQILAHLRHPNVAQLYEAGATADGLPYFVMEYVAGRPIDEFIRAGDLSLNDRLKLFRLVCSAVSYAHQNLVIHRDLKPGNILVTETGQPKLLDFGIAKLLQAGTDKPAHETQTQFRVLTPQYSSPEQIKGEPITTASDVYSLGVLLYELLTGQRPYRLKRGTADEITKAICEQEPTRPSAVASGQWSVSSDCSDSLTTNGGSNKNSKFKIQNSRLLKGDLDNIILKALRKEPERRYSSVEQFSEDIRRQLEGLPVTAHKGSLSYRASKFVERNKIAVGAAALIVMTLTGGIIATTVEARRANRRFNEARQLAHTILFDYHDEIAALPGSTKVRERMVKDALEYLDKLSKDAGNDVSLLREVAAAYGKVASVQGGAAVSNRGAYLSASNLGDTQGALASMQKSLAMTERALALDPRNKEIQQDLGDCYGGLATLYSTAGPPDKTVESIRKALPIYEQLLAADPTNEVLQYDIGSLYVGLAKALGSPAVPNLGDTQGALDSLHKAQVIGEKLAVDHPKNLVYQQGLGMLHSLASTMLSGAGKDKEALEEILRAVEIDQVLVKADASNSLYERELAVQLGNAGSFMKASGDNAGALEEFKQALTIYESLVAADPNDVAIRRNSAVGYRNVGVAIGTDNRGEAMKNLNKALEIFADLVTKDPINGDFRRQWAYTYLALSRFQVQANDLTAAVSSAQAGIKIEEALVTSSPTNVTARTTLALLERQLGDSYVALASKGNKRQWEDAKEAYQKSLDVYQDLKNKGTLSAADSAKPEDLAKEIAKCDAALSKQ